MHLPLRLSRSFIQCHVLLVSRAMYFVSCFCQPLTIFNRHNNLLKRTAGPVRSVHHTIDQAQNQENGNKMKKRATETNNTYPRYTSINQKVLKSNHKDINITEIHQTDAFYLKKLCIVKMAAILKTWPPSWSFKWPIGQILPVAPKEHSCQMWCL